MRALAHQYKVQLGLREQSRCSTRRWWISWWLGLRIEREKAALNLDPATVIAGLPIKTVRDAIREMNRHDLDGYGWSVNSLAAHMKISATHAEWLQPEICAVTEHARPASVQYQR